MFKEIGKIQKWEFEKKFILDYCSNVSIYNSSASSSNTISIEHLHDVRGAVIHGRILPTKDPYCFASFRIEIRFPLDYPFGMPEVLFLDPIYHPAIQRHNGRCCCCLFKKSYIPTSSLVELIEHVLNTIDNHLFQYCCTDAAIDNECRNNYEQFYETALQYTLNYGLPRH
jgi:ubiquitin-protein ligase